jgi:hypothetical protein
MTKVVFGPGGGETSVSGAAAVGNHLFLAPDEGASLVRLTRSHNGDYSAPLVYPVSDFFDPPGDPGDELDLEGMDYAGGYLWFIGSHSNVRARVKADTEAARVPSRLAEVKHPKARRLLARVPLQDGTGIPGSTVAATATHEALFATRLSTRDGQGLLDALRSDEHIGPFLAIPGKDNGFDVEGLVALPPRLLVGLRGPVLRGWAIVLEIEPRLDPTDPRLLQLAPLDSPAGPGYRKHFLDMDGLGVRDLTRHGDDLLILAGPTMLLDGPSRILRIPDGASHPLPDAVRSHGLVQLGDDLIVGRGHDHPEAITVISTADGQPGLLIAYDTPEDHQLPDGVTVDVLALDSGQT